MTIMILLMLKTNIVDFLHAGTYLLKPQIDDIISHSRIRHA